jgi:hypothetical protein
LITRIESVTNGGHDVYLSAHSQGAVIAASTVAALRSNCSGRVGLLTYGSPATRLYARFFPAYFGTPCLLAIGDHLVGAGRPVDGLSERVRPEDRSTWPWLNLYRKSDLIGGYVFVDYGAVEAGTDVVFGEDPREIADIADLAERATQRRPHWKSRYSDTGAFAGGIYENGDVDWQFVDPLFDRAGGDREYPVTLGHSDYWHDPAFKEALRLLAERREMNATRAGATPPITSPAGSS